MRRLATLGLLAALGAGCQPEGPTAPPPTPPRVSCETANTATISFRNRSSSNSTYDVLWDEVRLETLPPSERSGRHVVSAGVEHRLLFRFRANGRDACGPTLHTLAQCSDQSYSCSL